MTDFKTKMKIKASLATNIENFIQRAIEKGISREDALECLHGAAAEYATTPAGAHS